ncbi:MULTISPECIES: ABC transporter substrate-binding protein [Streptomyces]|jgi:peptide/nickel transport system substrate-binding protein|uniref:Oligopeptide-binding lipoprotein n=4 Tax=Streptomyces TaxID=1883 RepID=F3NLF2_9ACTN|nr:MULTISPECIES: ABC transporter substrate-binding protein [Streptomyces]EGG45878.1 oligopeptide-binding lipoprotein [Streptomyces griseoaurantiacus M045]MBA5221377.1 peptide-binding protein [Streptomyces griseoaurantiacus]MCF0089941.1 Oligopeptide-binding protein OppA [Streptomyces sp. MH192]MDX3087926.1 ABC transporter substrate-binding protein [Streptomyces sp. ME12-02E]MDX3331283.1 ABC transporter substrate-binding protein [Streptomyces sp. ME02-6978a]
MNRKTLVLPALVGLLAPVLAACGGSDSGSSGGDAIVVGTTDAFSQNKNKPAPMDPAYAYDVGTWNILRQTVQTLMAYPKGDGAPQPDAAESCGFTDSGNERYACTLRKDLQFSDGSPVTADDVKFSMERALTIKDPEGVFALLSTIDTIETKGDREVIFHLKTADATFPFKLSTPVAGILNPKDYEKDKLREGFSIDASGPYTMKAEVKNDSIVKAVFTKNPHYKGMLKLKNDKVELKTFPDADSMGDALAKGDIDVMTRAMTPEQIDKLSAKTNGDIDLVEMPGLEVRYLGFNTEADTVKNTAVREAMAQIINRGQLVSEVYGSQAEPLYSMVAATVTGHNNAFLNKYGDPSVSKARNLMTKAGITTPVKLTMHYTTDHYGAATKKEFEVLQKQLNASGLFDVSIKGTPWDDYKKLEQSGKFDVYGMGWFPDFPDADNYLAPFLDKDNTLNSPYVSTEIRNQLLPRSRREADRLSASKDLGAIQNKIADDVPLLPLWQGKQYIAARDNITGSEWAINSSSTLQLWELGRGVSS